MTKKKNTALIIILSVLLVLILAGTGVYLYFFHGLIWGCTLNNISVLGIDIGGKTPEEATDALTAALKDIYSQPMEITIAPHTVAIQPDDAQISIDTEAIIQNAYDFGRVGSYFERKSQQAIAENHGYQIDIVPYLSFNEEAVKAQLETFLDLFKSELSQTTYEIKGDMPDLTLPIEECVPQTLVITKGTSLYEVDIDSIYEMVVNGYHNAVFQIQSECTVTAPDELYIQNIYDKYTLQPIDAVMDENFQISSEVNGYTFDLVDTIEKFNKLPEGKSMEVDFHIIVPTQTYQTLFDSLFQDELATYTAYQASSSDRATNLRLACEAINGTILYPGDTFSFNKIVGERTAAKGYRPAAAYIDGESVDSYGGGVCQVASALYYCCLHADYKIVERTWHMYPVSYVPFGMDATIYWGLLDYKFKNNFNYPVRIDAYADGGSVTVHLMGTEEKDYYVDMEYSIIEVLEPETVEVIVDVNNNPKGYKDGDEITSPHTGYHVRTYKYKYNKADNKLVQSGYEADSHYRKRDQEIARIPVPTVTTDPLGVPGVVTPDG